MSEYNGRWMWCGECQEPLLVSVTNAGIVIECPTCNRRFEHQAQPPGGEVDGLPPFLGERIIVASEP